MTVLSVFLCDDSDSVLSKTDKRLLIPGFPSLLIRMNLAMDSIGSGGCF